MKVYAKELFQLNKDELGSKPLLDRYEQMDKFEVQKALENLDPGERIRVIDKKGNLYDVVLIKDNVYGIQEVTLRLEYGKMRIFTDIESLEKELPDVVHPQKLVLGKDTKLL